MSRAQRTMTCKPQPISFEIDTLYVAQTNLSYATKQLQYQQEIHMGFYAAVGQQLSPKLLESQTLREALTGIANKAMVQGYSTLAKVVLHLFELPSSIYRTKHSRFLDIFVHVPLYEVVLKATSWKRERIPFSSPRVLSKEDQDYVTHTVWNIADTNEKVTEETEKLRFPSHARNSMVASN